MNEITSLTNWLLVLIPAAAVPRAITLIMAIAADQEQADANKRKLKNLLCFCLLAETAAGVLAVLRSYLLGG